MILASIRSKFRLRTILVVPFVLQIVTAVSIVGYLSLRSGQQSVNDLVSEFQVSTAKRVEQNIQAYLESSQFLNRIHAANVNSGDLNPDDFDQLRRYFLNHLKIQNQTDYYIYANAQGNSLGVVRNSPDRFELKVRDFSSAPNRDTYELNQTGEIGQTIKSEPFDPRTRPFYQAAVAAGKTTWSPIFVSFSRKILRMDALTPLYTETGEFRGVFSTEVTLGQISKFLNTLNISPGGKVFILERSGEVVASSTNELSFVKTADGEQRLPALQSQEAPIRETSKQLLSRFQSFGSIRTPEHFRFDLNDRGQLVYVRPYQDRWGLDWLVVIVVPESDFMGQINANTYNTIWLCVAGLGLAIAIGIFTTRWVTRPILEISEASAAMAEGNIDQHVGSSNLVEIDCLTTSFNRMAEGMMQSFDALRHSEARNQAILNAIPDLMVEVSTEGIYLDSIEAKDGKWLACDHENRVGKQVQEVLPAPIAQQYIQAVEQVLQTKKPLTIEYEFQIEDQMQTFEARVTACRENSALFLVRNVSDRKQSETALRSSEERFRGLVSNIPGAIYRCQCDSDWTMEYISDAIENISGYPAADFIQNQIRSYASIIDPEDRDVVEVIVNHAMVIQEPYFMDYRILHRDNSIRWVYEQGQVVFDADENPLYLDGAIFDMTERKQAEEDLRIAEENYRSIFENALEGIFQSSPKERFISVNPALARIYGYDSPTDMIESITNIGEQLYVDPENRNELIELLEKQGKVKDFECRCYCKDGSIIWSQIDTRAVKDNNGNLLYYEGIVQDISDRKRREDELRRQLEELKIEIDQKKREKEVALLTESSFFQEVQQEMAEINLDEFWS